MPQKQDTIDERLDKLIESIAQLGREMRASSVEEGRQLRASIAAEGKEMRAIIAEDGKERRAASKEAEKQIAEFARIAQESGDQTLKRIEQAEEARGRAAEAMFRKSLPLALEKAGMHVDYVEPRRLRKEDREYDFVARNGKANFVGEIKVRFRVRDLAQLSRLLMKFREDYPEKAGNRAVYGIVCGQVVDEDAANIARKEGLLVVEGKNEAEMRVKPHKMRNYACW